MKIMIALLCAVSVLVISAKANAGTVFVAKVPSVWRWPTGEAILEFRHNADLRRAWISATLCEKYIPGNWEDSECKRYNQYDFRVVGLVYDSSSGEIRLGKHICAQVENGLLGSISRQTGHCGLTTSRVREEYDDGIQGHWRWVDVITIQLK
jgi:hypothetical protein